MTVLPNHCLREIKIPYATLLILVLVFAICHLQVREAEADIVELVYDDGTPVGNNLSPFVGVKFSLPSGFSPVRLTGIFYAWVDPGDPVTIHITAVDHVTELTTPIPTTAGSDTFSYLDVSSRGIVISGDFYVVLEHTGGIGNFQSDAHPNVGRSFTGLTLATLTNLYPFGNIVIHAILDTNEGIDIQNVRYPDQVKVGQKTYISLDVKYELLPPDTPLTITLGDPVDHKDYTQTVSNNGTITPPPHTFEFTAPAVPTNPWILFVVAYSTTLEGLDDVRVLSIEVKNDLGIAPEVEGICIWSGPPPPEDAPPSKQIEIPIEVKYAVTYDAWLHVGVYSEDGTLISTGEFDEYVSGVGISPYTFTVTTPAAEGPWNLKASLYYGHVAGVDSVHKECDEWPFTLIVTSGVPAGEGVKIIDVNSPTKVNSSAEVKVDIQVEYELPAGSKYRTSILDATSGEIIKMSGEESAASHGFKIFSFDGIYAPFVPVDTSFKLVAAAEYQKPGEDWKILDPEGMREFEILVRGVAVPAGELPLGPDIPPPPLPPDVLPPPPADFDYTLTVNPSSREAVPGQTISYGVSVSASVNTTQFVLLGVSGYPLGATVNLGTLGGTPTYTSNLTLTLGDSVQPGTYTLTVDASGGDKTHSQTVSLNVKAAPDFSVALSQPEVRIIQGQSGYLDMTVQSLNGFSNPVNLAVKGSPSGVTVNFNPASSAPSFTSKIEVKVDGNVAAGTYPLTITAKGSGEKVAQAILDVEAPRQEVAAAGQQPFPYGLLAIIILLVILISLILAMRRRGRPRLRSERFCIQCGAKVHLDAAHCPKCGVKQP